MSEEMSEEIWIRIPEPLPLLGQGSPIFRRVSYDAQDRVILTRAEHEGLLRLAKYRKGRDELAPKEPTPKEPLREGPKE